MCQQTSQCNLISSGLLFVKVENLLKTAEQAGMDAVGTLAHPAKIPMAGRAALVSKIAKEKKILLRK